MHQSIHEYTHLQLNKLRAKIVVHFVFYINVSATFLIFFWCDACVIQLFLKKRKPESEFLNCGFYAVFRWLRECISVQLISSQRQRPPEDLQHYPLTLSNLVYFHCILTCDTGTFIFIKVNIYLSGAYCNCGFPVTLPICCCDCM